MTQLSKAYRKPTFLRPAGRLGAVFPHLTHISLPYHGPFLLPNALCISATEPLFTLILTAVPRLCQANPQLLCNLPVSAPKKRRFLAVLLSRFHPVGVFSKNTGVTKTLAKIYLDFSPECDIMIAKGNHYSSRLAAQKARAAFRLTAKTGGNSMGILWYNDCQRQSLRFPS